jgi:D-alanine-D-alanine ligase
MGQKINVCILFGGQSGEHEVSIVSAASVYKALDKSKYNVSLIGIDKTGRWLTPQDSELLAQSRNPRLIQLNQEAATIALTPFKTQHPVLSLKEGPLKNPIDVILPILHGTNGEDGTIQGLLELTQIPYVGSGVVGSSVGMDKDVSRRLLAQAGIPVVPTITLRQHEFQKNPTQWIDQCVRQLGLPFFVKPANSGSSVGVHKVKSKSDADAKLKDAFSFDTKVLAEKAIAARELECAVLGNHEPKASIIGEIIPNHEFYSYEAKYMDAYGADLKIPAMDLTPAQVNELQTIAVKTFQCLELRGLARVDFFLDKVDHKIYLNEVNTIPGFTSISMYPKLWEASGLPYSQLLDELIRLAIEIKQERLSLKTDYQK